MNNTIDLNSFSKDEKIEMIFFLFIFWWKKI